ncbi:MAG: response regulator [SAR324 cluster bacterium]|nr:response regulator [SAR324 cluster bacterium]
MKRILVIDDEQPIREYLKIMMEKTGYTALDAADGDAGLTLLAECPCDLIITDIFMPNKEGLETILELKSKYPSIKIIAISGGGISVDDVLGMSKEFGADYSFQKPINMDGLINAVKDLIGEP